MIGGDEDQRGRGGRDVEGPLDAVTSYGVAALAEGHKRHAGEVLEPRTPSDQLEVARDDVDRH